MKTVCTSSFTLLIDSYSEGRNCELASAGRTKSNVFRKKRAVLQLLVNSIGYLDAIGLANTQISV